jgi:hypothetical protein
VFRLAAVVAAARRACLQLVKINIFIWCLPLMGKSTLPHYPYLRQLVTSHALFISLLTCTLAVAPALPLETARAWPRAAAVGPAAVARPGRPSVDDIGHWRSPSSTLISPHAGHVPLDEPVSDLDALFAPQSAHSLITDTKPPTRQAAIHHLRLPSASSFDSYTLYKRRRRTSGVLFDFQISIRKVSSTLALRVTELRSVIHEVTTYSQHKP